MKKCILFLTLAWAFSVNAHAEVMVFSKFYYECLDGKVSDFDLVACNREEMKIQDAGLNHVYQTYMAELNTKQKQALIESQRAWVKHRDLETKRLENLTGGTMDAVIASSYYLKITNDRSDFFTDLLASMYEQKKD